MSVLPTKAELTMMLYKAWVEADAENRRKIKEKAAAKKAGAKKKSESKPKEKSTKTATPQGAESFAAAEKAATAAIEEQKSSKS